MLATLAGLVADLEYEDNQLDEAVRKMGDALRRRDEAERDLRAAVSRADSSGMHPASVTAVLASSRTSTALRLARDRTDQGLHTRRVPVDRPGRQAPIVH